ALLNAVNLPSSMLPSGAARRSPLTVLLWIARRHARLSLVQIARHQARITQAKATHRSPTAGVGERLQKNRRSGRGGSPVGSLLLVRLQGESTYAPCWPNFHYL